MTDQNTKLLADAVRSSVKLADDIRALAKRELAIFVHHIAGDDPVTFNDRTGFPQFADYCAGCVPVVAVKVVKDSYGTPRLRFNTCCGDDCYGLNPDGWFIPENYGEYVIEDFLSCLESLLTDGDL